MLWGSNTDYQLGLGRRSNISVPTPLPVDSFVGGFDVDRASERMLMRERRVSVLKDMEGQQVAKNVTVEQTVTVGWGCTAVYWKVAA